MSTTPRPRRSNANLHPAAILLQDKQTRRSSAEVAKEKAELEARRKAILDQRAANLQELALLEERLKQQDISPTVPVGTPAITPQRTKKGKPSVSTATSRRGAVTDSAALAAALAPATSVSPATMGGRGAVADGTMAADVPSSKGVPSERQKAGSAKLKRASRADVEAYRSTPRPQPPPLAGGLDDQDNASMSDTPAAGRQTPKRKMGTDEKELEERLTKKGKMTKRSGVTPAAAAKFALPSTTTTQPSTTSTQPAKVLKTSSILNSTFKSIDSDTFSIKDETPARTQDTAASPLVTVEFGGYISDGEEVVEVSPAAADVAPVGQNGPVKVEIVDVAVLTANTPALGVTTTIPTPGNPSVPGPTPFGTPNAHDPTAAAAQLVAPRSGSHWAMSHVEQLLGPYSGNFTLVFIPRLIDLIGNHANGPWHLYGLDLVAAMQDLAVSVWPTLAAIEIIPRRPFYEVAKQKLSEYRNGMANEAVDVVSAYLQSKRFSTNEDRAEFVAWALSSDDNYPFRYARISNVGDKPVLIGVYQSKLIGRTFAYHLRRIGMRADQMRDWPCNALALATTAVERALKMWQTGSFQRPKPRSEEVKFSDRLWGKAANEYLGGITNLEERQWDAILALAETCMLALEEDSSDDDTVDSDDGALDLPMTGGRAAINDAEQDAYEFEMRGHPEA